MAFAEQSPGEVLIEDHYERLGLINGWPPERVMNLCTWLGITPYELGRLYLVPRGTMKRYFNEGKFPPTVALHFAHLEAWYLRVKTGKETEPLVPVDLLRNSHL